MDKFKIQVEGKQVEIPYYLLHQPIKAVTLPNKDNYSVGANRQGIKQAEDLIDLNKAFNIEITTICGNTLKIYMIEGLTPRGKAIVQKCNNLKNNCNHTFYDNDLDEQGRSMDVFIRLLTN